ncbi:hypothetical protein GOBAR_DD20516 [Gossypium barbadense]|nr:hypothetical protein GOBAR_DD20516 [Gossypium barbadense]
MEGVRPSKMDLYSSDGQIDANRLVNRLNDIPHRRLDVSRFQLVLAGRHRRGIGGEFFDDVVGVVLGDGFHGFLIRVDDVLEVLDASPEDLAAFGGGGWIFHDNISFVQGFSHLLVGRLDTHPEDGNGIDGGPVGHQGRKQLDTIDGFIGGGADFLKAGMKVAWHYGNRFCHMGIQGDERGFRPGGS